MRDGGSTLYEKCYSNDAVEEKIERKAPARRK